MFLRGRRSDLMTTRRDFLKAAMLAPIAATASCARLLPRGGRAPRLRSITYNVYACYGWVPDEKKFKQRRAAAKDKTVMRDMAQRFADALRPLRSDIITFAESPAEWVIKEIADRLGMRHVFFKSGQSYPGALITRLEVLESANCPIGGGERPKDLFTRHWGRATLRSPLGDLVLHSVHLHPSDDRVREREVTEILKAMEGDLSADRPLIFQGDFNHTPARPEYGRWTAAGLLDTFRKAGVGSGITMPAPTGEPPKRIDFIWAHGPIVKHLREARVLAQPPFGLDPSNPESFALSDHLPVMASFR
jgi:endonuclease/exonuclease/phosphatase family metal-dependent hydrolase